MPIPWALLEMLETSTECLDHVEQGVTSLVGAGVLQESFLRLLGSVQAVTGVTAAALAVEHSKVEVLLAYGRKTETGIAVPVMSNVVASNAGVKDAWGTPDQPRSWGMNLHYHMAVRPLSSSYDLVPCHWKNVWDAPNRMPLLCGLYVRGLPGWARAENVRFRIRSCFVSESLVVARAMAASFLQIEGSGCTRSRSWMRASVG